MVIVFIFSGASVAQTICDQIEFWKYIYIQMEIGIRVIFSLLSAIVSPTFVFSGSQIHFGGAKHFGFCVQWQKYICL